MRARWLWLAGLAALGAALAACGGEPEAPSPSPAPVATVATATPAVTPAPTLTQTPTLTATPTPAPPPELITIATGERGVIVLEWTSDLEHAVTWQYRQRGPENDWVWLAWTDIPGGVASTRSYRVTGLRSYVGYEFQVRAVVGTEAGDPSDAVTGGTPEIDEYGIPAMPTGQIVEGGRTWRVSGGNTVIDVPAGMRLVVHGGALNSDGSVTVTIGDVESGSWLNIDIDTAEGAGREIATPAPDAESRGADTPARDVNALFDQILASARLVPSPTPTPLSLITVSDGATDAVILEWTGGPTNATKWQYRLQGPQDEDPWSSWADIPNSNAATSTYRVGGLCSYCLYYFEVRPVVETVAGTPSAAVEGTTARMVEGTPLLYTGQLAEGGRTWRIGFVTITVPAGMRIIPGRAAIHDPGGSITVGLQDAESGSWLILDGHTGEDAGRIIAEQASDAASTSTRDVNMLFDQIVASIRLVPRPPEPATTPTSTPTPPLTLAECKRVLALGDLFRDEPPTGGPCLIIVSDGTPDALMLEWAGGPENTTKWQYRLAIWTPENHPNPPWGEWRDLPNSGPATRAYRLTGLIKTSHYRVQIRGITGTADGAPSNTDSGATHLPAPHFPSIFVLNIVEGDGKTRWRIGDDGYTVVFPKGMRLRFGTWALGDTTFYAPLYDVLSGSALGLESTYDSSGRFTTAFTGARDIVAPTASTTTTAPIRDVNALFDQIEASLRRVPLASEIEDALARFRSDQGQAPTPSLEPVTLTTVAPPDAGALILEWTGPPSSITKWQYRQRGPIWQGAGGEIWSEWRDIPGSDASTQSFRLGGLAQFREYFFQVRGWPALTEGATSNAASATTLRFESDGIPHMMPGQVVEGGATYRIGGLDYVTTVPGNARLMMGGGTHNSDGSVTVSLFDVATGSYLLIDSETGEYVERTIAAEGNTPENARVNALFDQIVASIRLVPRPPEPTPTPTPAPAVEMPAFEPVGEGTYTVFSRRRHPCRL